LIADCGLRIEKELSLKSAIRNQHLLASAC
jgi:hypothetical protein